MWPTLGQWHVGGVDVRHFLGLAHKTSQRALALSLSLSFPIYQLKCFKSSWFGAFINLSILLLFLEASHSPQLKRGQRHNMGGAGPQMVTWKTTPIWLWCEKKEACICYATKNLSITVASLTLTNSSRYGNSDSPLGKAKFQPLHPIGKDTETQMGEATKIWASRSEVEPRFPIPQRLSQVIRRTGSPSFGWPHYVIYSDSWRPQPRIESAQVLGHRHAFKSSFRILKAKIGPETQMGLYSWSKVG